MLLIWAIHDFPKPLFVCTICKLNKGRLWTVSGESSYTLLLGFLFLFYIFGRTLVRTHWIPFFYGRVIMKVGRGHVCNIESPPRKLAMSLSGAVILHSGSTDSLAMTSYSIFRYFYRTLVVSILQFEYEYQIINININNKLLCFRFNVFY
ncbi:hypothetical protein BDQ17DRAFT_1345942 [Cyathus striatus]|nr:hypothetical protein BDQ17DRAFT_1345942 [Cyathus striatus]